MLRYSDVIIEGIGHTTSASYRHRHKATRWTKDGMCVCVYVCVCVCVRASVPAAWLCDLIYVLCFYRNQDVFHSIG